MPTESKPVYIIFTHPSLEDKTNNDIKALPKSSKLYFRLIQAFPSLSWHCVLLVTFFVLEP